MLFIRPARLKRNFIQNKFYQDMSKVYYSQNEQKQSIYLKRAPFKYPR